MKKVMIVLDYKRLEYYSRITDKWNYSHTKSARALYRLLTMKSGFALTNKELSGVDLEFAYPAIPDMVKGHYKQPAKSKIDQYKPTFYHKIAEFRPNVIVGMGQSANQILYPKGAITHNRGLVKKIKYADGLLIPTILTFSIESTSIQPYKYNFIKTDFNLAGRVFHGKEYHTGINMKNYHYITDFSQVINIFHKLNTRPKNKVVAVDTETNSLRPWLPGSKIIVFSLSWRQKHGVCIPLFHKNTPWNKKELKLIVFLLRHFMMDDKYKVLHNGKYDIKFMMLTLDLPYATNCIDTLLMHYVGVSEEQSISRGLKPLAIDFTTMGDYSAPLKKFKQQVKMKHYKEFLAKYNQNQKDLKAHKTKRKVLKKDYKPLKNKVDGGDFNYEWIPLNILAPYAAMDTDATLRLYNVFKKNIDNPKWINLIYHFYPSLENALSQMEADGMHLNSKRSNILKAVYKKGIRKALGNIRKTKYVQQVQDWKLGKLRRYDEEKAKPIKQRNHAIMKKYYRYYGTQKEPMKNIKFNPNSTQDVKMVIDFAGLFPRIPFDKDYMTGTAISDGIDSSRWSIKYMSAGKQTLNYLATKCHSKFCINLLKYKKMYKLYDDFICKLPRMTDDKELIHPKFIMSGTVTHRLASRDPNAQQIPAGHSSPGHIDYDYPIKSMFTSRFKHGQIINFDFKSFEVFVVTALCGEPNLVSALCNGYDAHKTNASRAFQVPYDKVTPLQRQHAKKVTFGCLYGISIPGLADQLHITKSKAQTLYSRVLGALPVLSKYMKYVHWFVQRNGYVQTIDGFRRRLPGAKSNNYSVKHRALRESLNAIVQGSTTYFIGLSIIAIQRIYRQLHMKSKLICTVHDSIVCDSPNDESALATYIAIKVMQNLPVRALNRFRISDYKDIPKKLWHKDGTFQFPFVSNAGIGNSYGKLVPFNYNRFKKIEPSNRYDYLECQYKKGYIDDEFKSKMIAEDKYQSEARRLNDEIKSLE